ncbi:hypothetical protein NHX12_001468 [Muraenolepis orangiensis]|uniref:C3H1-type domain-containing protein n=1 Tax=Muraenolepis orangiensis TaxID=630683 RepID=A0A9Q0E0Y0_9TELE|nr:hypothetical protein NHX12_001468 [Muraenolepis orangiensis]
MTQPGPGPGPVRDLSPGPPLEEADLLRMDFFRKLGFSPGEVKATLRRLGPTTDTNSVLGELVGSKTPQLAGRPPPPPDPDVAGHRDDRGGRPGGRAAGGALSTPSPPPLAPPPPSAVLRMEERSNEEDEDELKAVVIDGSNVAMSHGNKEVFSCQGILLAVNYFLLRGHTAITVFVPSWRKEQPRPDAQITDQYVLTELEKRKILVFTPSRRVSGKRVVCYDDRYIVRLAYDSDAVIVSNDTYQDLQAERPEWRKCIEERLLMYSFVNDKFMPPDDPLGRHGPSLDNFLRKRPLVSEPNKPLCPYDKKCTYGMKCKFYHPERANQAYSSLADELRERARISTAKPAKKYQLLPRGSHFDPGPVSNPRTLDLETEPWPYLEPQGSARPAAVTENALIFRDGGRITKNHAAATPSQKDWPGPACPSHHPYSGLSQDSGLGSYESQFSCDSPLPWSRPPQPSVYLEGPGPHSARVPCSLSGLPPHPGGPSCAYREPASHPWARSPPGFDPDRLDLRKKLHAIFNPYQVDAVMEMFPHLMDAQKLAAEILKLKAQGEVF